MWKVYGSNKVAKQMSHFDNKTQQKYRIAYQRLAQTPRAGRPLRGYRGLWTYPITTPGGEHRIIYSLKPEDRVIYVILIGSRESIYDLLKARRLR